jgi:hypothetical protein
LRQRQTRDEAAAPADRGPDIPGGPNPCQIFNFVLRSRSNTDGSVFAQWDLELGSKATKLAMTYKSF